MLVRAGARVDEDELTRAVLGLLRYLPPDLWLQGFVNELRRRNPAALSALETWSNPKVELWPSYSIPDEWKPAFWRPKSRRGEVDIPKGTICPDALIETDRWLMFVESEYSHDLDSEQMFQQFAIAGHVRRGRDFFVLLINKALTGPSHCGVYSERLNKPEAHVQPDNSIEEFISKSCTYSLGLPFSRDDVRKRFLWINWQSIQGFLANLIFENNPNFTSILGPFQEMIRHMRNDVSDLLENEGLIPIGFDIVGNLAMVNISKDVVPHLPVIISIMEFLDQLNIRFEAVPDWHGGLDILKYFETLKIWPECLPVIAPAIEFLNQFTIRLEAIPVWKGGPEILKFFEPLELWAEYIPEPILPSKL